MIRVESLKEFEKVSPTEKLLTLVFAIFARDKASELRFDFRPDPAECQLWYWVRDELLELVPPPESIWPDIYEILFINTKPTTGQSQPSRKGKERRPFPSFPYTGKIPVAYGTALSAIL